MRGFIGGEYQDGDLRGITFLAGQRGMGKTTEMVRLLEQCSGGAIFFDSISAHSLKGWKVLHQPRELKAFMQRNGRKRFRILYQPISGDPSEHFVAVCLIVKLMAKALGGMILGIDELDRHCNASWGQHRMPPALYDLVNFGRHYWVSMVATSRYPQSVARGFISQWETMRLFRMQDAEHVKYFAALVGSNAIQGVQNLDPYQFLLCRQGASGAQVCGGAR